MDQNQNTTHHHDQHFQEADLHHHSIIGEETVDLSHHHQQQLVALTDISHPNQVGLSCSPISIPCQNKRNVTDEIGDESSFPTDIENKRPRLEDSVHAPETCVTDIDAGHQGMDNLGSIDVSAAESSLINEAVVNGHNMMDELNGVETMEMIDITTPPTMVGNNQLEQVQVQVLHQPGNLKEGEIMFTTTANSGEFTSSTTMDEAQTTPLMNNLVEGPHQGQFQVQGAVHLSAATISTTPNSTSVPPVATAATTSTTTTTATAAASGQKTGKTQPSTNKEKWEENFERLAKFQRETGHCRITQAMTDRSFYSWINRQRHLYKSFKAGKKVSLNQEKVDRLNSIGFVWNVYDIKGPKNKHNLLLAGPHNVNSRNGGDNANGDSSDNGGSKPSAIKTWDDYLEELKSYKLLHGDTEVPPGSGAYPDLALWVEKQQEDHIQLSNGKECDLSLEKVVKLNCIGFNWEKSKIKGVWERRFEELRKYRGRFGDCNVPEKYDDNPSLGKWVTTQKQQYEKFKNGKKSQLTEERIAELETLEFEFDSRKEDTWKSKFEMLRKYKDEHGDCNVPLKYPPNPKLSFWVRTQREQYRLLKEKKRNSNMTEERIQKLEGLGFVWALKAQRGPNAKWDDRLQEVATFMSTHGHANISRSTNVKLSNWVTSQRKQRNLFVAGKPSSITQERIDSLNAINFPWVVREPQKREDRMQELREYKEEFGNCNVPKRWNRNKRLGQWCAEQRKQHRYMVAGKPSHMTQERVNELEALGFVWSLGTTTATAAEVPLPEIPVTANNNTFAIEPSNSVSLSSMQLVAGAVEEENVGTSYQV